MPDNQRIPDSRDLQVKPDLTKLCRKRIMTTPSMRVLIAKMQQAGYEARVEALLDISDKAGIIVAVNPPLKPDGHIDLAAMEDYIAASSLFLSQLSIRGLVDNQQIFRTGSELDIVKETTRLIAAKLQVNIPAGPPKARPQGPPLTYGERPGNRSSESGDAPVPDSQG